MSVDDIIDGAKNLIPPHPDLSRRFKYDLSVSLTLAAIVVVGSFHVAWACGYLSRFGLGGFALADDVSVQQAQLTNIQKSQISTEIREAKRQLCMAQQSKNQAALYSWSIALESAKNQYAALPGHTAPAVMNCDELLVGGGAD